MTSLRMASIPLAVPPTIALLSSFLAGLTSFGDAIAFHILWSLAQLVGLIDAPQRTSLAKAVLYLTVMPIANMPLALFAARKSLLQCAPFGAAMASTGMC